MHQSSLRCCSRTHSTSLPQKPFLRLTAHLVCACELWRMKFQDRVHRVLPLCSVVFLISSPFRAVASSSQTDPPFPDTSPFLTKKVPRIPQILHNDLPSRGGIFLFWYRLNKSMFRDSSHLFSLLSTCPTVHQLAWPSGPILVTGGIALLEVAMTEQEQHLYPENYACSK